MGTQTSCFSLFFSYPELKLIQSINAHPSNCICIKFDPTGKYFATGSADALVSLWDVEELVCVRCFSRSADQNLEFFFFLINLTVYHNFDSVSHHLFPSGQLMHSTAN